MMKLKDSKCNFCQIDLFGLGKKDCSGWIAINFLAISRVFINILSPILLMFDNSLIHENSSNEESKQLGFLLQSW